MLKRIQEPEAWEPQINQAAFEALDMAIEALDCSESPNSSDTISRQAAIDALANTKDLVDVTWTDENDNVIDSIEEKRNIIANWLEKVPPAQPERKKGKWEEKEVSDEKVIDEWQSARCSACGKYHTAPYMYYFDNYNYCPNCGARMKEEDA